MMITLYKFNRPTRSERIIWTLKELGLEYTVKELDPMQGEHKTAEYLALNPTGKVPTLVHNGKAFTESLAIMEYLNDLHPDKPLTPKTAEQNFQLRQALSYGMTEIEAYVWLMFQATKLQPFYQWQDGVAEKAKQLLDKNLPTVWQWLNEREYIAGNQFTFADIYYYSLIRWVQNTANVDLPQKANDYLQKLEQRPHFYR